MLTRDDFRLAVRPGRADFGRAREFLVSAGLDQLQIDAPGSLAVSVVRISQLTLLHVSGPRLTVMWRRQRPRSHERRAFFIIELGEVSVECGDYEAGLTAGTVLVIDPGRDPVRFTLHAPVTRVYAITAARNILEPSLLNRTDRLTAFRPEHASFTGMITTLLSSAITSVSTDTGPAMGTAIGNILRAAANELSVQAFHADGKPLSAYDLAMIMIASRCTDQAFDAERLAFALGMRLRTLQQRFAEQGTSIAVEIRRSRVRHAVRVLPDEAHHTLDAVARLSGFPSVAGLRAGLRAELGTTPSALRHVGAGTPASDGLRAGERIAAADGSPT